MNRMKICYKNEQHQQSTLVVFTFPCICLIVGMQAIKVKASADTELNPWSPPL